MCVRESNPRQRVRGQEFAPVAIEAESAGAGALGVIENRCARSFDRRIGKIGRMSEPKFERGAEHRAVGDYGVHSIACAQE